MNKQGGLLVLVACALAMTSTAAFAQSQGQGSRPRQPIDRGMDSDMRRSQDRMEMKDHRMDRMKARDHMQLQDRDIYGHELMSAQELNEYRDQIQNAGSAKEREELRAEHHAKMQARAKAQGVALGPASEGPIYGGKLTSVEERNQFREKLRMMDSDDERAEFMAQHRDEMQLRAKSQNLELDENEIEEAE